MTTSPSPVNPNRLTPEQLAQLLSAAGRVQIPREQIEQDLVDGAPQHTDGTFNLVHYTAWILKEMGRGD